MHPITLDDCRGYSRSARLHSVLTDTNDKPYTWTDFTVFTQHHPKSGTWTYGRCGEGTAGQTGNPQTVLDYLNNSKEN